MNDGNGFSALSMKSYMCCLFWTEPFLRNCSNQSSKIGTQNNYFCNYLHATFFATSDEIGIYAFE